MGEAKFKISDWLIADNADKPTALQYTHISKHGGYGVSNLPDTRYSFDTIGLRLAKPHEIPNFEIQYEIC